MRMKQRSWQRDSGRRHTKPHPEQSCSSANVARAHKRDIRHINGADLQPVQDHAARCSSPTHLLVWAWWWLCLILQGSKG